MAMRLLEMRRVLKPLGSIYYHCDPTMSHAVKLVMDAIFGGDNFRNEIIWHYASPGGRAKTHFAKKSDTILFYANSGEVAQGKGFYPDDKALRAEISQTSMDMHYRHVDSDGRRYREVRSNGKTYRYYQDEGKAVDNVWGDVGIAPSNTPLHREYQGYPTQKPLALLNRIIAASSKEGDLVLDPFCGCATACVAAQYGKRGWIGIDISPKAYDLTLARFEKELGIFQPKNHPPLRHPGARRPAKTQPRHQAHFVRKTAGNLQWLPLRLPVSPLPCGPHRRARRRRPRLR